MSGGEWIWANELRRVAWSGEEARDLFWQLAERCEKAEAEVRRLRGDDMKQCSGCFGTGKCRDEYDRFLWVCGLCDGVGKVPK